MKHRPTGLSLSKATVGFLQYKSAEGLSPVTVSGYDRDLKLWIEFQGDVDVSDIHTNHIWRTSISCAQAMSPAASPAITTRSFPQKTVYNLYIRVASFFTRASQKFQIDNPVKGVPRL